jgi:hypothetical protein
MRALLDRGAHSGYTAALHIARRIEDPVRVERRFLFRKGIRAAFLGRRQILSRLALSSESLIRPNDQ